MMRCLVLFVLLQRCFAQDAVRSINDAIKENADIAIDSVKRLVIFPNVTFGSQQEQLPNIRSLTEKSLETTGGLVEGSIGTVSSILTGGNQKPETNGPGHHVPFPSQPNPNSGHHVPFPSQPNPNPGHHVPFPSQPNPYPGQHHGRICRSNFDCYSNYECCAYDYYTGYTRCMSRYGTTACQALDTVPCNLSEECSYGHCCSPMRYQHTSQFRGSCVVITSYTQCFQQGSNQGKPGICPNNRAAGSVHQPSYRYSESTIGVRPDNKKYLPQANCFQDYDCYGSYKCCYGHCREPWYT